MSTQKLIAKRKRQEKTMNTKRIKALAKHLDTELEQIASVSYDDSTFEVINGGEYLVLTDSEADEKCKAQILDSLWAFRAPFILSHSKVLLPESVLTQIQGSLCEDANELVLSLITDIDHFVDDAIDADGRGHFLSGYDGQENEEGDFFIYRTN